MKRLVLSAGILALLLGGVTEAQAGMIGYSLEVTTFFQSSNPSDVIGGGSANSTTGTGFFRITNTGQSTFTGTIGDLAFSNTGGDLSFLKFSPTTLGPGASVSVAVGPSSGAVGGFNGTSGSAQPGVEITLVGTVTSTFGSEKVNLLVSDQDIHSGVFHTNPFGVSVDSYVLQGGDPNGGNTGAAFAESLASGNYTFSQAATATPEPASATLIALGALGMAGYSWRRRKKTAAPAV